MDVEVNSGSLRKPIQDVNVQSSVVDGDAGSFGVDDDHVMVFVVVVEDKTT
jgi:hypothetical protein